MRFDGPGSGNFEDRTGQSGGMSLGGGGAGLFGLLFQIVASKFGIVGILILALGYCALTQMGGSVGTTRRRIAGRRRSSGRSGSRRDPSRPALRRSPIG